MPLVPAAACGVGLVAACSATPPESRGASGSDATVQVSFAPAAKSLVERVKDPVTGELLVPPVAGAELLPTDPARPGVKNWRAPDGRLLVDMARTRASCATKAANGEVVVGDCAVAIAPAPTSTGSTP